MATNEKVLHCQSGDHEWSTPKSRGKYPKNCPEHAQSISKKDPQAAMREGRRRKSDEDRQNKIKEIVESPTFAGCRCDIHPEISDEELYSMKGCQMPWYICPALIRVRNAVGLHERQ